MPAINDDLQVSMPSANLQVGHRLRTLENALELGPRKKAYDTNNAFGKM